MERLISRDKLNTYSYYLVDHLVWRLPSIILREKSI